MALERKKKNHTIIICGPQKKEEKLAMFWEWCPALLWFWVVKLQHATCKLVWQSVGWSNVHSRPLTHLFHSLPALSLLMKRDWASWQAGVSSDVIVHYASCNRFMQLRCLPSISWNPTPGPLILGEPKCQVTFNQPPSVFLFWALDRVALPLKEKSHLEIERWFNFYEPWYSINIFLQAKVQMTHFFHVWFVRVL